jgi:pimeloyl-ACP methyl ester carboxylesterase
VAAIKFPTLVISATADKLTPVKYGRYLRDHIPGATQTVIEDAGHYMALEKPEEFTRIVSDFLSV